MTLKKVLDVGNCGPDHSSISSLLRKHFNVEILRADQATDTFDILEKQSVDLILINRKLDIDYSDGIDILRALKATSTTQHIPAMLITNYPEHQQQAVSLGALYGFGKLELGTPETLARLKSVLQPNEANAGA
jgi:response regulator RpfG family c-di-GMP phosphodiesterase